MKKSKKILLTAFSATLVTTLTSGLALTAFADEATKDYVYDGKYDVVYEDFDRADISDSVSTTTPNAVDLGETPHLHVEFAALEADTPIGEKVGQIYKNGSGSITNVSKGSLTVRMRAPDGNVNLSDLYLGLRGAGNNSDDALVSKTFDVVTGSEATATVSAEWANYTVNFAQVYEDDDKYPMTNTSVTDTNLEAIHIFAKDGVSGVLDIDYISYGANSYLTEFRGGTDSIQASAKYSDAGCYWADSRDGVIVSRNPKISDGGEMAVVNGSVGKYKYAVIEAAGDLDNLKVATTTDGTAWGEAAAYDKIGNSVLLTGNETGFKFSYAGEGNVTVKRIFLTNNYVPDTAYAIPVIDASTAKVLDDFSVDQSGFTGADDMNGRPETDAAGLYYRKSWNNGDKITVKDGKLVLDATNLGNGLMDFRFQSKSTFEGKYLVMKMAVSDGANLNNFRFQLLDENDGTINDPVYANSLKAGYNFKTALLDESNPYKDGDYYYVVVDIEESGLASKTGKYTGMLMYYNGTGKVSFDNIFFCNGIDVDIPDSENIVKDIHSENVINCAGAEGYAYAGYAYIPNDGYGKTIAFDITPAADDFDISSLRIEFEGVGTYWATANEAGSLKTADGKTLSELTYTKDVATHVVVDLEKSGIKGEFMHSHWHVGDIGAFKVENITITTSTPFYKAVDKDTTKKDLANALTVKNEAGDADFTLDFNPTDPGYAYACQVFGLDDLGKSYDLLAIDFEVPAGTDLSGVRFAFTAGGVHWASENTEGALYLEDGTLLADTQFTAGEAKTVYIDIAKSGIQLSNFHIHTNGTDTGAFKINGMKLVNYSAKDFITPVVEKYYAPLYAEQLAALPKALDKVAPEVSITTATTAKAGDEITIVYTASDNMTATADLKVTVSVTKDGSAVTLKDNKFTAEKGVYTVTVTVADENGNEATDTIQITVSEGTAVVPPAGETGCGGGCASTSIEGGLFMGGLTVMGISILFAVNRVIRKKKEN